MPLWGWGVRKSVERSKTEIDRELARAEEELAIAKHQSKLSTSRINSAQVALARLRSRVRANDFDKLLTQAYKGGDSSE